MSHSVVFTRSSGDARPTKLQSRGAASQPASRGQRCEYVCEGGSIGGSRMDETAAAAGAARAPVVVHVVQPEQDECDRGAHCTTGVQRDWGRAKQS